MQTPKKIYACIDLKSFYASVECVKLGLDPLATKLVVADPSRGPSAICLAITPALKELGIRNRCRLREIPKGVEYLTAVPHMRDYMEASAKIYAVYLRYLSAEDIHVYSIDECFLDLTPYLELYCKTPKELTQLLMDAVLQETGIYATAGVGTNLFLCKVALDITAKHVPDRIGYLDEAAFREKIWHHRPITDIWNIGPGIARRLAKYRIFDLHGITRVDEALLYKEFGVNAEFLINHAWGQETCTMHDIHSYQPVDRSMTNGQILPEDYSYDEALVVLREMVDASVLEMVGKALVTDRIFLRIGYSWNASFRKGGARSPQGFTGGQRKLGKKTNSFKEIWPRFVELFEETTSRDVPVRRIHLGFGSLYPEELADYDLFTDFEALEREHSAQKAILEIKDKFGKNALLKGTSLGEKATMQERNTLIGGHRA